MKPIVPPVYYKGMGYRLSKETINELELTEQEQKLGEIGVGIHKFNHIHQNILMASKIRQ